MTLNVSRNVVSSLLLGVLIFTGLLIMLPEETIAHPPESMDLMYDYFDQTINITITHTTPATSQHYIENIEILKNDVSVLDESFTEQADLRILYYEFEIFAEDNDVLEVIATCNLWGTLNGTVPVVGPKDRMEISVNEIDEIEMGEEYDFTLNIQNPDSEEYVEGVNVDVSAWEGVVSEVDDLGIGGYSFTYTAPELQDEVLEVINITASRNGYHTAYLEFDFDIIFPVDPDRQITVTLSPKFTTIDEGETRDITVTVEAGGQPLEISEIQIERSGGVVSDQVQDTGIFLISFRANDVGTDVDGWIKVTAEKEGYAKGSSQMTFKIKDLDADDDTGDDDDTSVNNNTGPTTPLIIGIVVVILVLIGGGIGFFIWKKSKKEE